jgi:hypothetical protein
MRNTSKVVSLLVALLLLGARDASAQPPGGRAYDPATAATVRGRVTAVERPAARPGRGPGVHLRLDTASGPLTVRLGPAWYLDEQKLALAPGDEVEVTGSRATVADEPTLIAAEVKTGDRVVTLRDRSGVPRWRGRGRPR